MSPPTINLAWATASGGNVVTGLVPTSAIWIQNEILSGVTYGRIRYAFSGSPDLSAVTLGLKLTITGFTHPANNGVGMEIVDHDDSANTIDVLVTDRTTAALNETGVTGTGVVLNAGAARKQPSAAQQAQGWVPGQKPGSAHFNWWMNGVGQWQQHYANALPVGYDLLQARLTQGDNISITNNGDGTQRISANLTVTMVPAIGETFTQSSHGFIAGDCVRHNGTSWLKAQGNTMANATDVWLTVLAPTTGQFTAIKSGRYAIPGHGLTVGTLYYLSPTTPGMLTSTKPVGTNSMPLGFHLPVVFVESSSVLHILGQPYPVIDQLIAEYVAASNQYSIEFTNLDYAAHGPYFVKGESFGGNGANLFMLINNENGGSSYNNQRTVTTGTSITTSQTVTSYGQFGVAITNGSPNQFQMDIRRMTGPSSTNFGVEYKSSCYNFGSSAMTRHEGSMTVANTANLTSLQFKGASGGHDYLQGSTIRIYRGKS